MRKVFHLAAVAAVAVLYVAATASAQTVDALIAKNLEARGGEAKLRALNTMRINGKVSIQGMELPMTVTAKRPNMMRQEMSIQDKKVVTAFDGEKAWMINPMMGADAPQEIPGPQGEMTKEQSDFDGPLLDYKAKGHTVELIKGDGADGTEKLPDGTSVYKLKVTRKAGRVQYLYLDAESGIELKTGMQMEQGGKTITVEQELADYRPEGGIMVPHAVRTIMDGQLLVSMTVEKVEFNVPVEDAFFKMPVK